MPRSQRPLHEPTLLESLAQHMAPGALPAAVLDRQAQSLHVQHPLGHSALHAQALAGGSLLACGMAGRLRQRAERPGTLDDPYAPCLGLTVALAGRIQWQDARGRWLDSGAAGSVLSQSGPLQGGSALSAGGFSHCHVAASRALLERWLGAPDLQGLHSQAARWLESCLRGKQRTGQLQRHGPLPPGMAQTAARLQSLLLSSHGAPTLAQALQIEGLTLALIGQWLEQPGTDAAANHGPIVSAPASFNAASARSRARWQRAVDDAVDILRAEFARAPSIAELARRVGLNECYLKRHFRQRTGLGIAAFVRQQRMACALALLESGPCAVQDVARHVGYQSLGHFARAFRAAHGCLPSDVRAN